MTVMKTYLENWLDYLHIHLQKECKDARGRVSKAETFLQPHFGDDGQNSGN